MQRGVETKSPNILFNMADQLAAYGHKLVESRT